MGLPLPDAGGSTATVSNPKAPPATDEFGNPLSGGGGGGSGYFQHNLHLGPIGEGIDWTLHEASRGVHDITDQLINFPTGAYQLAHDAIAPGYHPSWSQLGEEWKQFLGNPLSVFSAQSQEHDALNRDITGMYHATVHSLNPHEIIVHPGNAAATLLFLGAGVGGPLGKASEIASIIGREGKLPEELTAASAALKKQRGISDYEAARLQGKADRYTRTIDLTTGKPRPVGSQIYDALAYGLPRRERLLTNTNLSNIDYLLADPGNQLTHGWEYSKNPTILAAQALVDRLHRTFPDTAPPIWRLLPPLWRSQDSRIGSAERQLRVVEGNTDRLAAKEYLRKWGGEENPMHMGMRLVAEGTLPEDAIADGERLLASDSLNAKMKLEMQRRIETIKQAEPLLGREDKTYPGKPEVIGDANTASEPAVAARTHTLPIAADERLQQYIEESRKLSNERTFASQMSGLLGEESKFMRNVGPLNYLKYGEVPERINRLMRSLAVREGMAGRGDFSPEQLARNRQRMEALQARINRATGKLTDEEKAKLPQGGQIPIAQHEAEWLTNEAGLFRVPYEVEKNLKSFGATAFRRAFKGGSRQPPPTFTHPFKAGVLAHGGGDLNTAKLLAESYTEAHRYIAFQKYARRMYAAGSRTPEKIPPAFRILMKDPDNLHVHLPYNKAEEHSFSIKSTHAAAKMYEAVRAETFPEHVNEMLKRGFGFTSEQIKNLFESKDPSQFKEVKGYHWVDSRTLGGLDKKNPLLGFMEHRTVRSLIHFFDIVNAAQKASILYLKPAYAVPNMLGNVFLNLVQQGPLAPYNLALSVAAHKFMDPSTKLRIRAAVGEGSSDVLRPQGLHGWAHHVSNQMANFYGKFVDDPFRFSSFLYEARASGFRSISDLHMLTHDARLQDQFHAIANRANNEMINYELLSPGEQAIARRVIFFYPWVKGSTRYATQFVKEHPVGAGATAAVGEQGTQLLDELFPGGLPPWAEGLIPYSKPNEQGYAEIGNPQSAAILQEPADLLRTFTGLFQGHPDASAAILKNLSPSDAALLTLSSQGQVSSIPHPASWSPIHAALNEAFAGSPLWTFANFERKGPYMAGLYPDTSQLHAISRLAFLGSLTGRKFNVYKAAAEAQKVANPTGYVGG